MIDQIDTLMMIEDSRLEALLNGRWENRLLHNMWGCLFMTSDPKMLRKTLAYLDMLKSVNGEEDNTSYRSSECLVWCENKTNTKRLALIFGVMVALCQRIKKTDLIAYAK